MQSIPLGPHFESHTVSGLGLVVLIAFGLVLLALIAVVTVVLAAGKPVVPFQRILSFAAMLVWIVPALGFVGLVVYWRRGLPMDSRLEAVSNRAHSNSMHVHDEMRSTNRTVTIRPETRDIKASAEAGVMAESMVETLAAEVAQAAVESRAAVKAENPVLTSDRNPAEEFADWCMRHDGRAGVPLAGKLRVRQTVTEAPGWAENDPVPSGEGVLVPLSSQRFATMAEAEQNVTEMAAAYVKQFYRDEYPIPGAWAVPASVIEHSAVSALVGEEMEKDFGNGIHGKMYRAHLRLDVNPALRRELHASWHDQIVAHRLTELGGFMGLATLMLATAAGYFRLDEWTSGHYRRRLMLAATALVSAGGLIAWHVAA